jgi:hypothetical protein
MTGLNFKLYREEPGLIRNFIGTVSAQPQPAESSSSSSKLSGLTDTSMIKTQCHPSLLLSLAAEPEGEGRKACRRGAA